jgi:type IV fimbrial biogenesis protein FimT
MELMIVIALVAVILAIGAPNFREFRQNNRLTAVANDFLASVTLARTEAVKRQSPVSLCGSDNPEAATATCVEGDFSRWIVFEDADGDCERDADEPILRAEIGRNDGGDSDLEQRRQLRSVADGSCVSIGRTGFTRDVADSATRFVFCDGRGIDLQPGTDQSLGRGIILNRTGRAQITRDATIISSWELECPP